MGIGGMGGGVLVGRLMDEPSAGSGPLLASVAAYARCGCCCTLSEDPDWCFLLFFLGGGLQTFVKKQTTWALTSFRQRRMINNILINMFAKWLKCIQLGLATSNYSHCCLI